MSKPIEIDLRRDLPKVREQLEAILPNMDQCHYSAPCAVGVMMTPEQRAALSENDGTRVGVLIDGGRIIVPSEKQRNDIVTLQHAFDGRNAEIFERTLARLEAKYLTGEVG